MSTTNLFVELIVIGVGAAAWLILLILGFSGLRIEDALGWFKTETAVPLLAIIYVLGIVIDRIADTIFEKVWGDALRSKKFGDLSNYYKARRDILTKSERLSELLEYGRSRLRICRGWCFNSVALMVSLNIFLLLSHDPRINKVDAGVIGSLLCLWLAAGTWYAWKKLTETEYRKIREQSEYLRETADESASAEQ